MRNALLRFRINSSRSLPTEPTLKQSNAAAARYGRLDLEILSEQFLRRITQACSPGRRVHADDEVSVFVDVSADDMLGLRCRQFRSDLGREFAPSRRLRRQPRYVARLQQFADRTGITSTHFETDFNVLGEKA